MIKFFKAFIIIFLSLSMVACSYKPILDQNAKFNSTPKEEREAAVEKCTKDGDEYLKEVKKRRVVKETARKGVIGAVFGTIIGVIFGGNMSRIATSAAVGAGTGAAVGGLSVAGEGSVTPDQIKQNFVSNCLARQGYSIIGWE